MALVFISHSSKDKGFARKLSEDLRKHGHDIWLDEKEIKIGDLLGQKITEGITKCDYFLIIISTNSIQSKWVEKELHQCYVLEVETSRRIILPIRIDNVAIPAIIADKVWADFSLSNEYYSSLYRLLNSIGKGINFNDKDVITQGINSVVTYCDERGFSSCITYVHGNDQQEITSCLFNFHSDDKYNNRIGSLYLDAFSLGSLANTSTIDTSIDIERLVYHVITDYIEPETTSDALWNVLHDEVLSIAEFVFSNIKDYKGYCVHTLAYFPFYVVKPIIEDGKGEAFETKGGVVFDFPKMEYLVLLPRIYRHKTILNMLASLDIDPDGEDTWKVILKKYGEKYNIPDVWKEYANKEGSNYKIPDHLHMGLNILRVADI